MRATVVSVFRSKSYIIDYWYHNTKKFSDDVESIERGSTYIPMMEIKVWKEKLDSINDKWIEPGGIITFATPEIIKKYTGFDLFEAQCFYKFEGRAFEIEFEWDESEYPYLRKYHSRDYITTNKIKLPIIHKIEDIKYDW